jgi:hypothetical protein
MILEYPIQRTETKLTSKKVNKSFKGSNQLTTKDTAESFEITIQDGLPNGAKCYLINMEMDHNEDHDADGATVGGVMKKGGQTGVSVAISAEGAIPGTKLVTYREGTNIFRDSGSKFSQYVPGEVEIPISDGAAKVTQTLTSTGHSAVKATSHYNGTVVIYLP